jgi:hypothetical protein
VNAVQKKLRIVIVILLALVVALGFFCLWLLIDRRTAQTNEPEPAPKSGNGLFSWHDEVFEADERQILFQLMRDQGLTELYQDVPFDMPVSQIKEFAADCAKNGIKAYLLIGEPEWALDQDGTALRAQIQRAALIGFFGVMVDVEPGSTDEWKEDREPVMETMTKSFLRGKSAAGENGLEMIVCLSYYYDDYGFEDELETIVERGCDALAIMNYNREDEIGQIETEAALCKVYGKRLIHIYELQDVGKYGLEEVHTYREAGLSALQESFASIRSYFSGQEITTALHEYRALKEMTGS